MIYGGSHIAVGIVENGKILSKIENKINEVDKENITDIIEQTILENIIKLASEVLETEQNIENRKIESIGIAVPGTVNETNIVKCVNLGIKDYNIVERLNKIFSNYVETSNNYALFERLPIKINLQNDAKCAAIAENKYGVLKEYGNSIFLTLGTGIGGAAIVNNELLKGSNVSGYEFGHMIIDKAGLECNCGKKGCFELYGSMKKFKKELKTRLNLNEFTTSRQLVELLKFDKALNKNDDRIREVIEEFTEHLSIGISNLINIFEPDIIGIGGSFVFFEEFLLEKLKEKILSGNLLFNKRDDIIIKSAILANDAGIIGASML